MDLTPLTYHPKMCPQFCSDDKCFLSDHFKVSSSPPPPPLGAAVSSQTPCVALLLSSVLRRRQNDLNDPAFNSIPDRCIRSLRIFFELPSDSLYMVYGMVSGPSAGPRMISTGSRIPATDGTKQGRTCASRVGYVRCRWMLLELKSKCTRKSQTKDKFQENTEL